MSICASLYRNYRASFKGDPYNYFLYKRNHHLSNPKAIILLNFLFFSFSLISPLSSPSLFYSLSVMDPKLKPLVEALQQGKKAVFFLGAGVSTSCGIPDFRSPKTGLYAQLERLKLPYPEAVFDIDYFRDDPRAFYALCDELYPGKFFPSPFHFLLRLFQKKNLLQRVYTQNIDTLEQLAGVDAEFIIAAHGSFADNHCIDCRERMLPDQLKIHMNDKSVNDGIPTCPKCSGYVKPDIVFFGEGLPVEFFDRWDEDSTSIDVAIVAGTSLTVYPFAGLPADCEKSALRVLINNELVGDFKLNRRKTDVVLKRSCDEMAMAIAKEMGWEQELNRVIEAERKRFEGRGEGKKEKEEKRDNEENVEKEGSEVQEMEQKAEEKKELPNQSTELVDSQVYEDAVEELLKDPMVAAEKKAQKVAEAIKDAEDEKLLEKDLKKLSL